MINVLAWTAFDLKLSGCREVVFAQMTVKSHYLVIII
jgi:hypothetical protein